MASKKYKNLNFLFSLLRCSAQYFHLSPKSANFAALKRAVRVSVCVSLSVWLCTFVYMAQPRHPEHRVCVSICAVHLCLFGDVQFVAFITKWSVNGSSINYYYYFHWNAVKVTKLRCPFAPVLFFWSRFPCHHHQFGKVKWQQQQNLGDDHLWPLLTQHALYCRLPKSPPPFSQSLQSLKYLLLLYLFYQILKLWCPSRENDTEISLSPK